MFSLKGILMLAWFFQYLQINNSVGRQMTHEGGRCNVTVTQTACSDSSSVCIHGLVCNSSCVCVDLDECSTQKNTCHNGGTCVNTVGSYTCNCTQYRSGTHCDTVVPGGGTILSMAPTRITTTVTINEDRTSKTSPTQPANVTIDYTEAARASSTAAVHVTEHATVTLTADTTQTDISDNDSTPSNNMAPTHSTRTVTINESRASKTTARPTDKDATFFGMTSPTPPANATINSTEAARASSTEVHVTVTSTVDTTQTDGRSAQKGVIIGASIGGANLVTASVIVIVKCIHKKKSGIVGIDRTTSPAVTSVNLQSDQEQGDSTYAEITSQQRAQRLCTTFKADG